MATGLGTEGDALDEPPLSEEEFSDMFEFIERSSNESSRVYKVNSFIKKIFLCYTRYQRFD